MFVTALPFAIEDRDIALGGFIVAMILIGLGQGGTTAVIFPFLGEHLYVLRNKDIANFLQGDQIPERNPRVIRNKTGELVVTDPELTIQVVFNYFYWLAIGCHQCSLFPYLQDE